MNALTVTWLRQIRERDCFELGAKSVILVRGSPDGRSRGECGTQKGQTLLNIRRRRPKRMLRRYTDHVIRRNSRSQLESR